MEIKKSELVELNYGGVRLNLKLDYDKGEISFLDNSGNKQKFDFTNRGTEYLGGWVKIFKALEQATIYGNDKLIEQRRIRDKIKTDKLINIFTALAESPKADERAE